MHALKILVLPQVPDSEDAWRDIACGFLEKWNFYNATAESQMEAFLKNCSVYQALENKTLNIPKDLTLLGTSQAFPYVIVVDDAFPLKDYIMKPYSQQGLKPEKHSIIV